MLRLRIELRDARFRRSGRESIARSESGKRRSRTPCRGRHALVSTQARSSTDSLSKRIAEESNPYGFPSPVFEAGVPPLTLDDPDPGGNH